MFDHCLIDLLYRRRIGELPMDVVGDRVEPSADDAGAEPSSRTCPTGTCRSRRETKAAQEAEMRRVIEETGADLIILARYMQVLSDDLTAFLSGRCINIHH